MNPYLITLMVFLPLLGAIIQAFIADPRFSRWIAFGASLASSLIAVALVASLEPGDAKLQAAQMVPWIGSYAISYSMGVDGLNVLLVLLVAIIFPILLASEWNQKTGLRGLHGLLMILQTALLGAVCAQDLFLLFFFWALSALPFYFLIGIWGGEARESAAFRSIVAASIGNALVFAALVLVYYSVEPHTFSIQELTGGKVGAKTFHFLGSELPVSGVAFALVSLGLALRTPIWPFHGWFTQVAEEAPPSVFVALSAVSVPVGAYVFVRIGYSLFPETVAACAYGIVVVGMINLLMGGICAVAQRSLKLLLAFMCVSQVGLILMGIGSLSSAGVVGAVYQLLCLGLALAGFGLFSGIMVDRTGKARFLETDGSGIGGVAAQAPGVALVAGVVVASLLGFPGMGGFVGHALLLIGSYTVHPAAVMLAGGALLLATYYLFTMYRYVFLGKATGGAATFTDLTLRERAYLFPIVACLLVFGIYPKPLIELVRPTVTALLGTIVK